MRSYLFIYLIIFFLNFQFVQIVFPLISCFKLVLNHNFFYIFCFVFQKHLINVNYVGFPLLRVIDIV